MIQVLFEPCTGGNSFNLDSNHKVELIIFYYSAFNTRGSWGPSSLSEWVVGWVACVLHLRHEMLPLRNKIQFSMDLGENPGEPRRAARNCEVCLWPEQAWHAEGLNVWAVPQKDLGLNPCSDTSLLPLGILLIVLDLSPTTWKIRNISTFLICIWEMRNMVNQFRKITLVLICSSVKNLGKNIKCCRRGEVTMIIIVFGKICSLDIAFVIFCSN